MPTYGEILSKDSDGKKFMSALTNNGGANEFTAIKGANRATQNSEAVADLVVTLDGETVPVTDNGGSLTVDDGAGSLTTDQLSEYTDGATFTRSSSKLLAGLAGIYESAVSTLTAGKVALARLTSRGAVVTAGDVITATKTLTAAQVTGGSNNNIDTITGLSADDLRGFEWQISLYSTLDAAATVSIFGLNLARGADPTNATNRIYSGTDVVSAGGDLILSPYAAGANANAWVQVEALSGIFGDMDIHITAAAATSGSIVLGIEGRAK